MEDIATITKHFSAIVLAADREIDNPVAAAAGVLCKSLVPIDNTPMIFRVLNALRSSSSIADTLICGPPKNIVDQEQVLEDCIATGKVAWMENEATPSMSAYEAMKQVPQNSTILLTSSDHALLSPRIVDFFCKEALTSGCDVVVALARHETVMSTYPQTSRTAYRFKDGAYCSCNLFAFLTERGRTVPTLWRQVEEKRKNPLRVISVLGWSTVLLYLMRKLTLSEVAKRISGRLGCNVGIVVMPYPEAAIDVDTVDDWRLVQHIVEEKREENS